MTPRRWLVVALIVLVAALLYSIEWVEVARDDGFSDEARRNPYLAAQQFAAHYGIESVIVSQADVFAGQLETFDGVLLMPSTRRLFAVAAADEVLDWVASGGHLVTAVALDWNDAEGRSGDPIIDPIGLRLYPVAQIDTILDLMVPNELCPETASLADVHGLPGVQHVDFPLRSRLDAEGLVLTATAVNAAGPQMVQVAYGDGVVTAATSFEGLENRMIGCHQHAHWLRKLVGDGNSAWWLLDFEALPLWALVYRDYALLVKGLALVLLLWLWRRMFRPAPVVAIPAGRQRATMERVAGHARFLWQQQAGSRLLDALRQDVRRARSHEPADDDETIRWAMTVDVRTDQAAFVRAVQILKQAKETK